MRLCVNHHNYKVYKYIIWIIDTNEYCLLILHEVKIISFCPVIIKVVIIKTGACVKKVLKYLECYLKNHQTFMGRSKLYPLKII